MKKNIERERRKIEDEKKTKERRSGKYETKSRQGKR